MEGRSLSIPDDVGVETDCETDKDEDVDPRIESPLSQTKVNTRKQNVTISSSDAFTKYLVNSITFMLVFIGASCTHQKGTAPKTISSEAKHIPAIVCWYVEDNGAGQHGYSAMDAHISEGSPEHFPLFPTIAELRRAMHLSGAGTWLVIPQFPGKVPPGWKIRDLTTNEINSVLGR